MSFSLGYSTYALKMIDPFDALHIIKNAGYEALEICLSENWPTSPLTFSTKRQIELRNLIQNLGFPSPIFFGNIDVCASMANLKTMLDLTKRKIEMAHRLHFDRSPILITTTAGQSTPPWNSSKNRIVDSFLSLASLAAEHDVVLAIEAHAGTDFETPEKAVWIMKQTQHPNLRLDLDISHFVVEGNEMTHSVNICAPYTSVVHIKDGKKKDGAIHFCLPGAGDINITGFFRALRVNQLEDLPVFAEVSQQQSSQPIYDPKSVADFCFSTLNKAITALD